MTERQSLNQRFPACRLNLEHLYVLIGKLNLLRDGAKVGEISGDDMTQEGVMHAIAGGGASHE